MEIHTDMRAYPARDEQGNPLNHAELCAWRFGGTCDCEAQATVVVSAPARALPENVSRGGVVGG